MSALRQATACRSPAVALQPGEHAAYLGFGARADGRATGQAQPAASGHAQSQREHRQRQRDRRQASVCRSHREHAHGDGGHDPAGSVLEAS